MKKLLSILAVFAFVANNANAQCSVYSNGNVESVTLSSSASIFSVRDKIGYDASIIETPRCLYVSSIDPNLIRKPHGGKKK